jgi:hypothetical protein
MFLEHDPGENAPQMVLTLYSVHAEWSLAHIEKNMIAVYK